MSSIYPATDLPYSNQAETDVHREATNTARDREPSFKIGSECVILTLRDAEEHQARSRKQLEIYWRLDRWSHSSIALNYTGFPLIDQWDPRYAD